MSIRHLERQNDQTVADLQAKVACLHTELECARGALEIAEAWMLRRRSLPESEADQVHRLLRGVLRLADLPKPAFVFPTIHLGGTSGEALQVAWRDAYAALGEALRKLSDCCPNGRDYYPQPAGAFEAAVNQYRHHADAIRDAQSYLLKLHEHVDGVEDPTP